MGDEMDFNPYYGVFPYRDFHTAPRSSASAGTGRPSWFSSAPWPPAAATTIANGQAPRIWRGSIPIWARHT